jgi:hypothetical protein
MSLKEELRWFKERLARVEQPRLAARRPPSARKGRVKGSLRKAIKRHVQAERLRR